MSILDMASQQLHFIKTANQFAELTQSFDWHHPFLKSISHANPEYLTKDSQCSKDVPVCRFLIAFPYNDRCLEITAFDISACTFYPTLEAECPSEIFLQRRKVEMDFGVVSFTATAVAYRILDRTACGQDSFIANPPMCDEGGEFIAPYNVDWRSERDA